MSRLPFSDPGEAPAAFDYEAMSPDVARNARAVVERYRARQKAYVIDTGRDLLAVKSQLDHGPFLEWVEREMGMTPRSAQRAMSAAEVLGDKSDTVSYLPPSVLYELSAPSNPEPVCAAVLLRIEAGEVIRPEAIMNEVRSARDEARQQSAQQRENERRAALSDEERVQEDALRARGEKGRAARERRAERERLAYEEERQQKDATSLEAAQVLVSMIGVDRAAAYLARYGMVAYGRLDDVIHTARARATARTKIPGTSVDNFGAMYGFLSAEDRPRIEVLAKQIERDGLVEAPVVVFGAEYRGNRHYRVIDGADTFRALHDVLGWSSIPVHVAPPVTDADFALLPEPKAGA
jgi:hypothetical protein